MRPPKRPPVHSFGNGQYTYRGVWFMRNDLVRAGTFGRYRLYTHYYSHRKEVLAEIDKRWAEQMEALPPKELP